MDEKEKLNNNEIELIEDDKLEDVTGGKKLDPPRVDIHPYNEDVKKRM